MTNYIIIGVVAVVILFVIVYIKMTIDEKKGANSEEKQKVKDIVKKVVPNSEAYTAAYGTREEYSFGGGGRKNGLLVLYGKDRKELMNLFVVASNTKEDKYHPVNIQQKEEAEAFMQFAQSFAQEINAANGITDIKAAKKEARKG